METFKLTVNGQQKEVTADPGTPLLWVLREDVKMTGTKYGCGIAACGACTVHLGGVPTRSCVVPISLVGDRPIVTIEAMADDPVGRVVQDAWVSEDVVQCGYCQSGQIMSAVALLKNTPKPTDKDIEESMGGNLRVGMAHGADHREAITGVRHVQVREQHVEVFRSNATQGPTHTCCRDHLEPVALQRLPQHIAHGVIVLCQ